MRCRTISAVAMSIAVLGVHGAFAQSFGTRTLGSSVATQRPSMFGTAATPGSSPQGYPGTTGGASAATPGPGPGALLSAGRFLRQNRNAGSFVGGDARDASHFVGSQDGTAAAPIQSAVTAARGGLSAAASQALAPSAAGPTRTAINPPRLEAGFRYGLPASRQLSTALAARLEACPELQRLGPIAVSLEGRTATLRGTVASERDRSLAQLLILFEPGISAVRNELALPSPAPPPPRVPASLPPVRSTGPREF